MDNLSWITFLKKTRCRFCWTPAVAKSASDGGGLHDPGLAIQAAFLLTYVVPVLSMQSASVSPCVQGPLSHPKNTVCGRCPLSWSLESLCSVFCDDPLALGGRRGPCVDNGGVIRMSHSGLSPPVSCFLHVDQLWGLCVNHHLPPKRKKKKMGGGFSNVD